MSRYPHVKPGYNQSLMAFLPLGEKTARKAALSHSKDTTAPFGCNRMAALFSFKYSFLPKITLRGLSRCLFHSDSKIKSGLEVLKAPLQGLAGRLALWGTACTRCPALQPQPGVCSLQQHEEKDCLSGNGEI